MTAVLRVIVSNTGETLKVPSQALRFRPSGSAEQDKKDAGSASEGKAGTVWVIGPNGSPSAVRVALGASDDNGSQLTSGALREGDQLIVGAAAPQGRAGPLGIR